MRFAVDHVDGFGWPTDVPPTRARCRCSPTPSRHPCSHPSAVRADPAKLGHINTYGSLPDFYLDQPFSCRTCGTWEIWKARDQKWYCEEAGGHIDAVAVECHACRKAKRQPPQDD